MGTCLNYGSASNPRELQNASTMKFVKKQYNSFTLENEMKPDAILAHPPSSFPLLTQRKRDITFLQDMPNQPFRN